MNKKDALLVALLLVVPGVVAVGFITYDLAAPSAHTKAVVGQAMIWIAAYWLTALAVSIVINLVTSVTSSLGNTNTPLNRGIDPAD